MSVDELEMELERAFSVSVCPSDLSVEDLLSAGNDLISLYPMDVVRHLPHILKSWHHETVTKENYLLLEEIVNYLDFRGVLIDRVYDKSLDTSFESLIATRRQVLEKLSLAQRRVVAHCIIEWSRLDIALLDRDYFVDLAEFWLRAASASESEDK